MMAAPVLVSIVDDDESVRESLPDLVRQFGFAAQAFSSAEAFLASEFVSDSLPDSRPRHAGDVGPGLAAGTEDPAATHSDHLHHGPRRQERPIASACGGRRGMPVQALQRHGPDRCIDGRVPEETDMIARGIDESIDLYRNR